MFDFSSYANKNNFITNSAFTATNSISNSNYSTNIFDLDNTGDCTNSIFADNSFATDFNIDFFDFFMSNLNLFTMAANNNMSFMNQQKYFTSTFNTKTDLKELKDVYNPDLANKLANIAARNASQTNTVGWCARGANNSLQLAGLTNGETRAASAYQVADKLAAHKNFKEVYVARGDLKKLPAGCIIVWDKGKDGTHKNGHMTVTLGNGKEASDHVHEMYMFNSDYSVFVPTRSNKVG